MLGILFTFWGMGFLIFRKKGSFFLPRVMWTEFGILGLRYKLHLVLKVNRV